MTVISGGQTGVDQHALFAARAAGLQTGGWAPKGWTTEAGCEPWLADYGLAECDQPGYPARTFANVRDSHGTLLVGSPFTSGSKATINAVKSLGRPVLIVSRQYRGQTVGEHTVQDADPDLVVLWLLTNQIGVLNVAGNRESVSPGIGQAAEKFLTRVFVAYQDRQEGRLPIGRAKSGTSDVQSIRRA